MYLLNRIVSGALGALLWPFQRFAPTVGLAVVALLVAVAVLLVYRKTSDQEGITAVRRRIVGALLEMRLFRDDVVVVLRAQGQVLKDSLRYFGYSLVPLAWILLPLVVLFLHLDQRFGYDPLPPGSPAIVTVESTQDMDLVLEAGPGLAVETPSLRMPGSTEARWRIRALTPGRSTLTVRGAGSASSKTVEVGPGPAALSPTRPSRNVLDQLLHPGEAPLSSGDPVRRITVAYPRATLSFLGWEVHWVVPFLVLTILFGFALQKPLGVKL